MRTLTPTEARVLGTLMEKARTVPDSYPLTLNSLLSGCNQRTSRDPLMQLDETRVQEAIDSLKTLSLVFETSGGRAARYEHNFERVVGVPGQAAAILGLLMLRGPQTAGELRINTERWHRFADISSVEAFLIELQQRDDDKGGPLVTLLARASGMREQRWAHLLCGPVESAAPAGEDFQALAGGGSSASALEKRIAALESELTELGQTVRLLCRELGLSPPGQTDSDERDKTQS
ncbi:MAG: YceH family protein [Burkholderiales bacterium]